MTITELLAANPYVEVSLKYSGSFMLYSVDAKRTTVRFSTVVLQKESDENPKAIEDAIKRAMEAVR